MSEQRAKSITAILLVVSAVCGSPRLAAAQLGTPRFTDSAAGSADRFGVQATTLPYLDQHGLALVPGIACSEILRGNGTGMGYMLTHGGVIPASVRVSIGVRTLQAGQDYSLDPLAGTLAFAESVPVLKSISVRYRYVEGASASGAAAGGIPGIALSFGGTALNLGFGVSRNGGGMDFTAYGLSLNSNLGSGSGLNGLLYFSAPSASRTNLIGDRRTALDAAAQKAQSADAVGDHLIVQNLNLQSGATRFRATYQDIGQHFNGFQAMKQSSTGQADALAQLGVLEKEKGIRRLGFGTSVQGHQNSMFALDWDRIGDSHDSIVRNSLGLQSRGFHFGLSGLSVGQNFSQFQGLREADAAQWAREKGAHRTDLTLGFDAGKAGKLDFDQSAFGDKSGRLLRDSIAFSSPTFHFSLSDRKADARFARLNDLTDAEKTALALDIRRQFNLQAQAAEVTAADKAQIAADAGLSRQQMAFSGLLGKQSTFVWNQFAIGDSKGAIARRTLALTTKGISFHYLDQNISDKFGHLGGMSAFEKSQFANETGIHRVGLGLDLAFSKTSSLTFSQLSLSDPKGGMTRDSLSYKAKGIDLALNLADTAKSFARVNDLAGFTPAEKQAMEAERGYSRLDLTANVTAFKGLTLNSYTYAAHDALDRLDKDVFRHNLLWTPTKTLQLNLLSEGDRLDQQGRAQTGRAHDLLTFDDSFGPGMKLHLVHDALATIAAGVAAPTVTTDLFHFETNRAKPTNLLTEMKRVDLGAGKFEDTTDVDMNYRVSNAMSLHVTKLTVDRGKDPSSDTDTVEWKWQTTKTLSCSGAYSETSTNNGNDVTATSIAVAGSLTKQLDVKGTYSEVDQQKNNDVKAVSDVTVSTTKPVEVLGIKDVTVSGHYAAVNDQKKQQSEISSGKIAGLVDKHQVALEYGGSLAPNGQTAIARTVSFVSDPNPKLPIHCDILYKARNTNGGAVDLVRKYSVGVRLGRTTTANYTYSSLPEDPHGAMLPATCSAFALKHAISKRINLSVDYTTSKQLVQHTQTSKLNALLNDKIDPQTSVQIDYSVDLNTQTAPHTDAHTVKLSFDRQVDGDHFITLSTAYKICKGAPNDLQTNVDFKTNF